MARDEYISLEQLNHMKHLAAERNNWKEVERINKIIDFKLNRRRVIKGRKPFSYLR